MILWRFPLVCLEATPRNSGRVQGVLSRFAVAVLAISLPLFAETPKQQVQVTTTQRLDFPSNGTIDVNGSCGQLNIEGWDDAAVEVTVTRSVFKDEKERNGATQSLNAIRVNAERQANNQLTVSTAFPRRRSFPRPFQCKGGVSLDYRIKAPRNARLVLHHKNGDIVVYGMGGEIEAKTGAGTIVLQLPNGQYWIDAKCKVGGVDSDFAGSYRGRYLIKEAFVNANPSSPPHKIYLRLGFGRIEIQEVNARPAVH
jgi:hypothetical protein